MQFLQRKIRAFKRLGIRGVYDRIMYRVETRHRWISPGNENPDKIFYVIRGVDHHSKHYTGVAMNLLANYSYVLAHMIYADKRGWLPVVDQAHDPVNTSENFPIHGTKNPWEYFWCQPVPYNLEEVFHSKHVILSRRSWYLPGELGYSAEKHQDKALLHRYRQLSDRVPLNRETQEHIDAVTKKYFPSGKKILGISMRRGGAAREDTYHAPNHPIQPTPDEMLKVVWDKMKLWGIDFVFLATEEQHYIDYFIDALGDKLIYLPRKRYVGWKKYTEEENPLYQPGHRYQTALDYLTEMEMLARCQCLIGSITSGLRYALIRNGGLYEHVKILENGFWNI